MAGSVPMIFVVIVALSGLLPAAALGWWLLRLGYDGGDRPGDPTSRITVGTDGQDWLTVANHSATPVVVGAMVRDERRFALPSLTPRLVVRAARRHERSATEVWLDAVLGPVAPGTVRRWPVPAVARRTRLLVGIDLPGRGLRIHDHLVLATTPA